jgi:hypothetical protein
MTATPAHFRPTKKSVSSQSYFPTGGLPPISSSWRQAPWWSPPNDKVRVKITLRLTVSQSARLGVEPHLGLMTRYVLLFDIYSLVFRAPSLTRGLLYMLLAPASTVFLGSDTLSDLRLPFSSPPTTRMVTVEVFDPASTRVSERHPVCTPYITSSRTA